MSKVQTSMAGAESHLGLLLEAPPPVEFDETQFNTLVFGIENIALAELEGIENELSLLSGDLTREFGLDLVALGSGVGADVNTVKKAVSTMDLGLGVKLNSVVSAIGNISIPAPQVNIIQAAAPAASAQAGKVEISAPGLAQGGFVTRPTVAVIAEKRPEWVLPPEKLPGQAPPAHDTRTHALLEEMNAEIRELRAQNEELRETVADLAETVGQPIVKAMARAGTARKRA
ncbi:MAG: hypothetical protein GY862_00995 [Gammaproteobacteria bacterium]|nr:hypothetical protein [Gammaproteobacteria bacterium]